MNRRIVIAGALCALAANLLGCPSDRRRTGGEGPAGPPMVDGGSLPMGSDGAVPSHDGGAPVSCLVGPENSASACTDGCSNDGDPFVDCDDRDCCPVVTGCPVSTYCGGGTDGDPPPPPSCITGAESTAALCSDGCSNDGDAFIDCEDYDCCDVVTCPPTSACGMVAATPSHVSRSASDCVGTGTVTYAFSPTRYEVVTVALSTTAGYQIFGYTRDSITTGPFPLTGMTDERQVRAADLGSGLQLALSRWGGASWTGSEGGSATYSDASTINLATDADALYSTYACVGYLEGTATAGVLGGVDYMVFDFVAPIVGLGFPALR